MGADVNILTTTKKNAWRKKTFTKTAGSTPAVSQQYKKFDLDLPRRKNSQARMCGRKKTFGPKGPT